MVISIVSILFIFLEQRASLGHKKKYVKIKIFYPVIPSKDTKILELDQYQKSDKTSFIIYADPEFLIEKIDGCKNNLENSSTKEVSEHVPSIFSMSTTSILKDIKNKYDVV